MMCRAGMRRAKMQPKLCQGSEDEVVGRWRRGSWREGKEAAAHGPGYVTANAEGRRKPRSHSPLKSGRKRQYRVRDHKVVLSAPVQLIPAACTALAPWPAYHHAELGLPGSTDMAASTSVAPWSCVTH